MRLQNLASDTTVSSGDLHDILLAGLNDQNPRVRRAALVSVAARAGIPRVASVEQYRTKRATLEGLSAKISELVADKDAGVRRDAIDATAALEEDLSQPVGSTKILHRELGKTLIARYDVEPDSLVRNRIVNVFAWFRPEQQFRTEAFNLVERALRDSDPGVVQVAIDAVKRHHVERLLPEVVRLLTNASSGVRASAANAIGDFGQSASRFVSELEAVQRVESDEIVRVNLQSTLAKLKRRP